MSIVRVDGADIWYDVQGSGEPVMTVGGDIMAHDQFLFVYTALVKRHTVISWDFRNIGASERLPESKLEFSIDRKVEDMKAVLDAAGIERTHLWSVATGSFAAIVFAARYPERVASLIHYGQCAPTPGGMKMFEILQKVHDTYDWPTTCEHMVHLFAPDAAYMEWTIPVYVKNSDHSWMKQYLFELQADIRDDLRATFCPMLVMLGDRGPLGSKSSYGSGWQLSQECRPDTEISIVEGGTGTYYMVDAADRAAEQAMAFFARHPIAAA